MKVLVDDQIRLLKILEIGEEHVSLTSFNVDLPPAATSSAAHPTVTDGNGDGIWHDGSAGSYVALSYCWGQDRINVDCDGEDVTVSANCVAGLRRVHQQFPDTSIWTDTLSICQQDVEEKVHQIGLMGRIFASAQTVIVWLGEESEDGIYDELLELSNTASEGSDADLSQRRVDLLARLSQVQWFYRAWTFQEIRLARHAVVMLGSRMLPWNTFIQHIQGIRRFEPRLSTVTIRSEARGFLRFSYTPQDRFFSTLDELNSGTSNDLAGLLFLTWYRDASERRDKVYSLLSSDLLRSVDHGIEVDYEIPWTALCIKTARAAINTGQNLKILKIAGMIARWKDGWTNRWNSNEFRTLLNHPSWAPDWWHPPQQTRSHPSLLFDDRGCFSTLNFCCSPKPAEQDLNDTSPFLVLSGVFLGLINNGEESGGSSIAIHPTPRCAYLTTGYHENLENKRFVPKTMISRLVADIEEHLQSQCSCVPSHQRQSHASIHSHQTAFGEKEKPLNFGHESRTILEVPRPKDKTETEWPAQVLPKSVESGDWLVLLEGGGMPFILRPAKSHPGQFVSVQDLQAFSKQRILPYDAGCFVLVGEASMCWEWIWRDDWINYCRAGTFVLV
jgi:hypothetical protein